MAEECYVGEQAEKNADRNTEQLRKLPGVIKATRDGFGIILDYDDGSSYRIVCDTPIDVQQKCLPDPE